MLAQFSVWPLDTPHVSRDVNHIIEVLDEIDIKYQVGPMGTTIEGEWDEVLAAVKACHEAVRNVHERVLTTITIDDDGTKSQSIEEAITKVGAGGEHVV